MAAVLLRRIGSKQPDAATLSRVFDVISDGALEHVRSVVLQGLVSTQTRDVRHKISDAIAELGRPSKHKGKWTALLGALFEATKSETADVRESAFRIFASVPDLVGEELVPNVVPVFDAGFKDQSESVRIAASGAFAAFFRELPRKVWPTLHPLLPSMLNVLTPLQTEAQSTELTSVLESLIDLAGLAPKMFKPVLKTIVDFCIAVAKNKDMDLSARLSALELATTFADEAPNMVKKEPSYTGDMVLTCLTLMTEIGDPDDDEADLAEWNNDDDVVNSEDQDEMYSAAKQSLDRLALKLGGEVMLPPLFQWLPQMLDSQNWRERHAALMAISNVAEGCRDVMMPKLNDVLDIVVPRIDDPHVRVQWATCNALGQMSTDFSDYIQRHFAARVLPPLISKLSRANVPRVQTHAAAATVNFSENATKETLDPYLDSLLSGLLELLSSPKRYVQEQVLTTIAIVADSAENKFIKYYDALMPMLFNVMRADTGNEYRLLKAKSIECSTLIALAVGKDKFAPHCQDLVQVFASIQNSITDEDDPCQAYLVHAWGRLCRIIGKDFVPYLSGVMPPLLAAAKAKPDIQLFEDEEEAEQVEGQEGWEIIPTQGKFFGIHTSSLDEKASAIDLISVYASELGADFYPYVKEIVADIIVPSLTFFYHDGVRYSAAMAVPHLLTAAQEAAAVANGGDKSRAREDPRVLELWVPMLAKMLELLNLDTMVEVLTGFYAGVYQAIELIGPSALNANDMTALVSVISTNLTDYMHRVKARQEGDADPYAEEVEEDDAEEQDEELTGEINKVVHSAFKACRSKFLPAFEQLMPIVTSFLTSNSADCRQWALCAIDDLIEYTGPDSWKYKDLFLPKMIDALVDGDAAVRQAAAYGIGIAAQFGGEPYTESTLRSLETLFNVVNVPEARSDENLHATENASAAIAKILHKNGQLLGADLDRALTEWVKTLPIIADDEAAPFAYRFLADLIQQKHVAVTSQVPKVFDAVAQALVMDSIGAKTAEVVVSALKILLVGSMSQQDIMALFESLPVESRDVVQKHFQ